MTRYLFHHTDSDGDQLHVDRGHTEVLYVDTSMNDDLGMQVRLYPAEVRLLWSALGEWLGTVEEPERVQGRHERPGPGEYSTLITAIESMHSHMAVLLEDIRDRAAVLNRAADFFRGLHATGTAITAQEVEQELRRMADEAQEVEQ